ncbi:MAG: hypothetical protein AB9903_22150 [Vulcanimicrobiota bacterium]
MAGQQDGGDLIIQGIGGRKNLANIYEMYQSQFNSIVGVNSQEQEAGLQQTQKPGAPFNLMQAKQGLDQREEKWMDILQTQQGPTGATQGQNVDQAMVNQQLAQNVQDAQQGAELDAKQGNITDDELKKYFGDQADAVRELLNKRSDIKLSDLLPLKNDSAGFAQLLKMLTKNNDLQVSDLVTRSQDGKVTIDKSVNDDETKELMEERNDIKPKELTDLKAQLTKALGNPQMAKKAFTMAMKLLKTRTDMKPEEAGKMFTGISEQLDSIAPKGDKSASAAGAKLEMFETAVDLLCTRRDLNGEQVVKLAGAVTKSMGDPKDSNSATRISQSFKDAADLMTTRQDISVDNVTGFLGSMQNMTKGKDPAALDSRASIFKSACNTLKQRPDMNFDNMTELLKRQTQGNKPKQGNALVNDFSNAATNLTKGQTMDQVAQPVTNQPDPKKTGKEDDKKKPGAPDEKDGAAPGKEEPAGEEDKAGNVMPGQEGPEGPGQETPGQERPGQAAGISESPQAPIQP